MAHRLVSLKARPRATGGCDRKASHAACPAKPEAGRLAAWSEPPCAPERGTAATVVLPFARRCGVERRVGAGLIGMGRGRSRVERTAASGGSAANRRFAGGIGGGLVCRNPSGPGSRREAGGLHTGFGPKAAPHCDAASGPHMPASGTAPGSRNASSRRFTTLPEHQK